MLQIFMLYFFVLKKFRRSRRATKFFNAEISCTCTWQHHSEKLKTSSGMEEYERACCNRGYHEYKVLTASYPGFCARYPSLAPADVFARQSLALADVLTTIVRDLEDHSSA